MLGLTKKVLYAFEELGKINKGVQIEYLNNAPIEELLILKDYGYKLIFEDKNTIKDFIKMPNSERDIAVAELVEYNNSKTNDNEEGLLKNSHFTTDEDEEDY